MSHGLNTPSAEAFAQSAAQADGYEIAAAHIALAQSGDARILAFAREMVADHNKSGESLRQAAAASGFTPPRIAVGGEPMRLLMTLQGLRNGEFDRMYAKQQVLAHLMAITEMRSYAEAGSDPDLRRLAQESFPIIERHLQRAREIAEALGVT